MRSLGFVVRLGDIARDESRRLVLVVAHPDGAFAIGLHLFESGSDSNFFVGLFSGAVDAKNNGLDPGIQ